jgi:hypothetical protein
MMQLVKDAFLCHEQCNAHFTGIFDGHGQVPVPWFDRDPTLCGWRAILDYQLALWRRLENGLDLCIGHQAFLKAACVFVTRPGLVKKGMCDGVSTSY